MGSGFYWCGTSTQYNLYPVYNHVGVLLVSPLQGVQNHTHSKSLMCLAKRLLRPARPQIAESSAVALTTATTTAATAAVVWLQHHRSMYLTPFHRGGPSSLGEALARTICTGCVSKAVPWIENCMCTYRGEAVTTATPRLVRGLAGGASGGPR